ncbi:MAG TPA: hypothetical protein VFX89_21195 [Gammaproteobacteria bacterium]|nr:hypothetical protein [Gammaproteobacteria bacterium]
MKPAYSYACIVAVLAAAPMGLAVAQRGGPAAAPLSADQLPPERRVPAEQSTALAKNPRWKAPRTSWGHPSLEGTFSTDDMRGIPRDRPQNLGNNEFLSQEQFLARATEQYTGRNRARNDETFLRNEWGTRTFGFTSLVVDPPNGRTPAANAAGQARAAASAGRGTFSGRPLNAFEDFSLYDRCIALGMNRGMGSAIYGNGIRIFQSPTAVTITYEMIHETRVIYLDGRPHSDDVRGFMGNSRGHWDGDTLVVETTGFTTRSSFGGPPNSEKAKTVERIRRVDPEMIEYRITVDDPDTYTAPFTVRTMWTTQPNYYVYEYSCHEGNFAVSGGLGGERAFEKQVEEAKAKGLPIPKRSNGLEIYRDPEEGAEVFSINKGE